MLLALSTGFFLGISLIVAIGAQNAFVLRQGILRQHNFYIAIFCSLADSFLIIVGVAGISFFFNDYINEYSKIIFGIASLWLFIYGVLRVKSAFSSNLTIIESIGQPRSLSNSISTLAIFTFANPHVYLDTVILIGSISQRFEDLNKFYFTFGACAASFAWFFGLTYGAKRLSPIMKKPIHWRTLDSFIALVMFVISFNLANEGNWF
jgi:L-lysine exporter family protein LysE/ArgO